jgi:hypothetical protein
VSNSSEFYDINNDLGAYYILSADIDLSGYSSRTSVIAPNDIALTGTIDGNGHKITGLVIYNNLSTISYVALIGRMSGGGVVKNLTIENCDISSATQFAAGLCSYNSGGSITNCHVSGYISGSSSSVGGICGRNDLGQIIGSSSECTVSAYSYGGGLTGSDYGGSYEYCYADCEITVSFGRGGGLIGNAGDTDIYRCYAAGSILGIGDYTGGICGYFYNSTMEQCYSLVTVIGYGYDSDYVGGLCGTVNESVISDCYNIGAVSGEGTGSDHIGGLNGYTGTSSSVTNCYSAASVSCVNLSASYVGGALGEVESSTISGCLWDTEASGLSTSAGGATGLTTAQMQTLSSFTSQGWDFVGESANGTADIWWISSFGGYPKLDWQAKPVGMDKYYLLALYWGQSGCTAATDCYDADWYRDGVIDENDLTRLSMSWLDKEILIYEP